MYAPVVNSSRLFVLSALARRGPMHGYQIRQEARVDRTDLWTDIKPGSLYSALHRMADECLVEVVRNERPGGSPERTVFAITELGRVELIAQRDATLRDTRMRPDPVDLALQYVEDLDLAELTAALDARKQALTARLAMHEKESRTAAPYLSGLEPALFEHVLMRLRVEITWHDDLIARLPELTARPGQANPGPDPDQVRRATIVDTLEPNGLPAES